MSGQPEPGSNPWITFDVANLQVVETGTLAPSVIVPINGPFDLYVTFDGAGAIWGWLEGFNIPFTVNYYAEGMGANAQEYDLGSVTVTTAAGGGPYTDPDTKLVGASIPVAGVYRLACAVTSGSPVCGFVEGPMIQVHD